MPARRWWLLVAEAAASAWWFESMDEHLGHDPMEVAHALLGRRHPSTADAGDADRSSWDHRLLRATQNPVLRRARWLVGAARRRRAAARLR